MDNTPVLLIVDPDEQFAAAVAAEAEKAGLRSLCCKDWWEARPILDGPTPIAAMIVELVLPTGTPNGLSAALMARGRRERLPVLFVSGEPNLLREVQPGTGATLAKTVGVERLVRCACELIEARSKQRIRPLPQAAMTPRLVLPGVAQYRLDDRARFRSVNAGALALWGKSRQDLVGRPMLEVFPQLDGASKTQAHLDVLQGRDTYSGTITSVILNEPIDIRIERDRLGLQVRFAIAA